MQRKKKKKNSSVLFHNKLKKFHNFTSKQIPVLEKTNPPPLWHATDHSNPHIGEEKKEKRKKKKKKRPRPTNHPP